MYTNMDEGSGAGGAPEAQADQASAAGSAKEGSAKEGSAKEGSAKAGSASGLPPRPGLSTPRNPLHVDALKA